jgi:hypothetical protein
MKQVERMNGTYGRINKNVHIITENLECKIHPVSDMATFQHTTIRALEVIN